MAKNEIKEFHNLSQRVTVDAKKALNKLSNDLGTYAIENGMPEEPGKGDILSRLIVFGAEAFSKDLASYFKK